MDINEEMLKRIKDSFKEGPKENVVLDLSHLGIKVMPVIPSNVGVLNLNRNRLTEIPKLNELRNPQFSKALTDLYIDYNKITELPDLPENLEFLTCSHNKLTELPEIPDSLVFLDCTYNNLDQPPVVPKNCTLIFYPQEKDILNVPFDAENSIIYDKIILGNSIVDFNNESNYGRFYKKDTFDKLTSHPIDPHKKIGLIKKPHSYIARLTFKKDKNNGTRVTRKNTKDLEEL